MIYDDLVAVHDQLNGPLEKMGNLYQQANDQISAAVAVDAAGAVTVDQAALRAAISEVVPPGSAGQYELLTDGLQMGFAVNSGGQRMLPWHALTNPDVIRGSNGSGDFRNWRFSDRPSSSYQFGFPSGPSNRSRPLGQHRSLPCSERLLPASPAHRNRSVLPVRPARQRPYGPDPPS